ncbi:MAG: efflux RND transporter periplasmic adaptor subunit [Verrucomicrobiales bacterium]|nr:efflux RND transporter periplasmic adaptor subunit [Verrucomicrobiales bacterium]
MPKLTALRIAPCLALLWLAGGCSKPNTFAPPPPPEVTVAPPEVRDVTVPVSLPGRLRARDAIEIRARISGYLRSVDFTDGAVVEQGAQLCVIEPEPYVAALKAAEATLEAAKASEGIAQTNYERRRQAYETRAISEIDLLKAQADLDAAKAAVLEREAAVAQARINLSYTTNTAPAAGRLGRRLVSAGNLVGNGQATLITTLVVEDPIDCYANVSERRLIEAMSRRSQQDRSVTNLVTVQLRLADGSVQAQSGTLDFVDNRVDPETGTIELRARFPNPNLNLVSGFYGEILVPQDYANAVLVPDLCVQRDIGGTYVLVVGAEDKVESRYVETGPKVGDRRIISKGLQGDERVIVVGLQRARPGVQVTPASGTKAEEKPE